MDQSHLRKLEAQCIQEEPPRCQAACPLHVDARALCTKLRDNRINEAWAVLCRTMPLPGVLARICDGPCKSACLRSETGGAIELESLERFCAEHATRTSPVRPMPTQNKTMAILGDGLAGLAAAWDLARKGFGVTLYCKAAGDDLLRRHAEQIPADLVDAELSTLTRLGVAVSEGHAPDKTILESAKNSHDAIFVDLETCPELNQVMGSIDPVTQETALPGVFAAPLNNPSPIFRAAAGRQAVLSIERHLQGASLTAGRDHEGPFETHLFTSLKDVQPLAPQPVPTQGYSAEQAQAEAARCLECQCLECVRHCAYLEHYKGYPKTYARQIYNNESIVMGTRHANKMINSCMLCGLCETLCPEDFSMADLCLSTRRSMVERDRMPPSAHEFALRDMAFANGEHCFLARHAPETKTSDSVFFPGCQLTASAPEAVDKAYAHLRSTLPGSTGLILSCCGAPAQWSGRETLFQEAMERLRCQWQDMGQPTIITACPTCQEMLSEHLPKARLTPLWNVIAEHGLPDTSGATLPDTHDADSDTESPALALHDPCTARHNDTLRQGVRDLLATLGVDYREPEMTGETTECCGYGGLLSEANPPLADTVIQRRAQSMDEDFVTYCAMCRDRLAKTGKPALHLLDLLFPATDRTTAAARPSPGYSQRRENRARLKTNLLRELWQEQAPQGPDHESIQVRYTEQACQNMEDRRILNSDVQKTLLATRDNGHVLVHADTGRLLTSHRPICVTYWVEYEKNGPEFIVHNVWSHRMQIMETQP